MSQNAPTSGSSGSGASRPRMGAPLMDPSGRVLAEVGMSARLLSLDAFRGLVVVLMFLVNVAGTDPAFSLGDWAPREYRVWMPHMGWNQGRMGNGLADYVFPWFLFIVGVAVPFSMASGRGAGRAWWAKLLLALRRGATIYLLGTLLWCASIGYPPADPAARATWHGPITSSVFLHWDILPLIGLSVVVCAAMARAPMLVRMSFVLAVLLFKWYALKVAVPPGTVDFREAILAKTTLQHTLADRWSIHPWFGTLITQGLAFSSISVLGTLAGDVLQSGRVIEARRSAVLGIAGLVLCLLACVWWWVGDLPFSKDLVSPTYILVTAGSASVVLAGMYALIDRRKLTTLAPLRAFGTNALFIYLLAELVWKTCLTRWQVVVPDGGMSMAITAMKSWLQWASTPTLGSYLTVAAYLVFYWVIARAMFNRRWFVKV